MKILIGDKGNVDFDGAIPMTGHQQDLFIRFMKTIFNPVSKIETNNFRTERIGDKIFGRRWDDRDEIAMLLDVNIELEKVCELLGRTWMSVNIKRGEIVPELMRWADSKGYNLINGDVKKIIEEYLKEKKEIAKEKRASRSSRNKETNKLIDKIDKLKTKLNSIGLRNRIGIIGPHDEEKIREANEEIKDIEDELLEKYNVEYHYDDGEIWYFEDENDE